MYTGCPLAKFPISQHRMTIIMLAAMLASPGPGACTPHTHACLPLNHKGSRSKQQILLILNLSPRV